MRVYTIVTKLWSEELHPRDESGRFGEGGSSAVSVAGGTTTTSVRGIDMRVPQNTAATASRLHTKYDEIYNRIGVADYRTPTPLVNSAGTITQLMDEAKSIAPAFLGLLAQAGGRVFTGEGNKHLFKTQESLTSKVHTRMERSGKTESDVVMGVGDAIRGSVVVDTPEQLGAAVRNFTQAVSRAGGRVAVDNKFNDKLPNGYAAVHCDIELKTETGTIRAEAQFHLRSIHDGTDKSPLSKAHKLYNLTKGVLSEKDISVVSSAMLLAFSLGQG